MTRTFRQKSSRAPGVSSETEDRVRGLPSLSYLLKNGGHYNGVVKDLKEAVKWYLKAADQGAPIAQFNEAARSDEQSRIETIYPRKLRNTDNMRKDIEASYQALVSKMDATVKSQQEKLDRIREQLAFFPDK